MSRAQKNTRRGKQPLTSAQRHPSPLTEFKGNGVKRTTGTERPQPVTRTLVADVGPARVIKTTD